jgi:diacylglycerol kinase family enzyme
MNIPLVLDDVMQLFSGDFIIEDVDTLQVGDQHFVLNVSTGISSRAMLKTEPEDKKRFGVLAYAQTILKDVMDTQPVIFNLDLDEHQLRVQGTEVLVSNGVMAQEPAYFFGKRHEFSDGKLEVNILTASETPQFIRLIWDLLLDPREPKEDLHDLTVKKYIRLDVEDGPQPVQADGELIGETPVEITIAPKSIRILVPKEEEQQSKEEKEQKEKEIGQAS